MTRLWTIERAVPGWTDEDVAAAGLSAKMCVLWYPNMSWIRSLYDREGERLLCVYEAENEEDIRQHAVAAGLPCDVVTPVDEVLPADLGEPTEGDLAERGGDFGRPPLRVADPA